MISSALSHTRSLKRERRREAVNVAAEVSNKLTSTKKAKLTAGGVCTHLIERRQVELLRDELLEVENGGLSRTTNPFPLESSELTAVTLQTDTHLKTKKK